MATTPPPRLTPRTLYLTLYNALLFTLWLTTLFQLLALLPSHPSPRTIFTHISPLARWAQTLALLEVLHSALGLVKAPVGTTAIQVFTRVIQVYTMFIPLYPIGIGAEWWLMYLSIEHVGKISPALAYFFYFLLALYVPGAYKMFTYMLHQRRKVLGNTPAKRE
ncbi:hypothetical protein GRF29_164g646795 [Pseudopithomyces chartarum]|uniref:Very-long-chain (3R)-3-hydroxyacyl-CoA dehydratase n=1 Tax=Pseudopithomyces chartarum TaxID=1892770 RepID=A0AAN6LNU1_9PLEO|nr:hypothetical protein GRF29_164g646795 [Pseudopithomyces chartarum]